jgi:hypothetical protein
MRMMLLRLSYNKLAVWLDVKINILSIVQSYHVLIVQAGGRKEAICNPSPRVGSLGCNAQRSAVQVSFSR